MKINAVVSAIMAIALASGGLAFADDHGERNDRGRDQQAQRGGERDHRDARQSERRDQGRHMGNNDERRDERGAVSAARARVINCTAATAFRPNTATGNTS